MQVCQNIEQKLNQDGGGRHLEFCLSLIIFVILHIFAQNLACALRLRFYIHACQNIKQK